MEKYNVILKEFYDRIPLSDKIFYEELANSAISLGYIPKRDKTKCISISFKNGKNKFTIMKFAEEKKDEFIWKFKFAANTNYSNIFDESIKQYDKVVRQSLTETYNIKNNITCFGCAKCVNVGKLFYTINYDGKKIKVCGNIFIHINQISKDIVEEAGKMMEIQHKEISK